MLTVHHLGKSQSERIVWLCEELEIPYELKRYSRDTQTMLAPPDYKALHPIGAAPVITDGNIVLAESGAVVEYIIAKYGNGRLTLGADAPDTLVDHRGLQPKVDGNLLVDADWWHRQQRLVGCLNAQQVLVA